MIFASNDVTQTIFSWEPPPLFKPLRRLCVSWVCCWFSPLLQGFSSGFSGFPPSAKINISKFQFDLGQGPQVYQLLVITCYPRKTKAYTKYRGLTEIGTWFSHFSRGCYIQCIPMCATFKESYQCRNVKHLWEKYEYRSSDCCAKYIYNNLFLRFKSFYLHFCSFSSVSCSRYIVVQGNYSNLKMYQQDAYTWLRGHGHI
jgi:hypothetical protein